MFLCTHRHSNLIIFLALQQTQALLLHDQLPVGWGGVITVMILCTHRHTKPYHLSCSPADAGTFLGVGWGNNVLVPVHTQAQQTLLSFLLSSRHRHLSGGWGWGGIITFMFLCTHRHSKPYHLSCSPADTGTALSSSVTGGVGWDNNVHVPVHTHRHGNLTKESTAV